MAKRLTLLFALSCVFITQPLYVSAAEPVGSAYLDGGQSRAALILLHGRGKYPTWLVVDPLRKVVHDRLGFHTLSLQMPNEDKDASEYAEDFPRAYTTIEAGIRFLREEKGVTRVFLMGHSMGARMASAFMARHPDAPIEGLIVAGCRNNGGAPLSCSDSLGQVDVSVLDIWGGASEHDRQSAQERSALASVFYSQVEIDDADHRFDDHEDEFTAAVIRWITDQGD